MREVIATFLFSAAGATVSGLAGTLGNGSDHILLDTFIGSVIGTLVGWVILFGIIKSGRR